MATAEQVITIIRKTQELLEEVVDDVPHAFSPDGRTQVMQAQQHLLAAEHDVREKEYSVKAREDQLKGSDED